MDEQDNIQSMKRPPKIQGGCVLLARKLLESELMNKPPLHSKLWQWMLLRAEWRSGPNKLSRGQFIATIADMQEAMSYRVGYRKITPTKDEIRSAYEALNRATMTTTTKTTRGMIITICNYDYYQDLKNYEAHNEDHNENATKPETTPHGSKEVKEVKRIRIKPLLSDCFETLWRTYPNKDGKTEAIKHFNATVKSTDDCQRIQKALDNYLTHLKEETWKKPKNGSTWFNNWQDWESWEPIAGSQSEISSSSAEEDLRAKGIDI